MSSPHAEPGCHAQPPRSGVAGLLPFEVRQKLISNGWGVLPIRIHDGAGKSAGKAPSIRGWQLFAQFGAKLPTVADLKDWGRSTLKAPGTGIATGNVIAIDLDLSDAVTLNEVKAIAFEVFGATPFVRQGRAPRVALIYRATEAIGSVSLKVLHGAGDGLDILANGRQFVAYGIHPVTRCPYVWIAAAQPLSSRP
ncbi:MAG: bifunctional DNA primase/polymerase, partial [Microvirga sp.]